MILLDTSAVVCGITGEPEEQQLKMLLNGESKIYMGAPLALEAVLVLAQRRPSAQGVVDGYLRSLPAEILPSEDRHYAIAVDAFLRFGKGRHKASLNFGDCMSYAFAKIHGLTLVYKGNDFGLTDLPKLHRLDDPVH